MLARIPTQALLMTLVAIVSSAFIPHTAGVVTPMQTDQQDPCAGTACAPVATPIVSGFGVGDDGFNDPPTMTAFALGICGCESNGGVDQCVEKTTCAVTFSFDIRLDDVSFTAGPAACASLPDGTKLTSSTPNGFITGTVVHSTGCGGQDTGTKQKITYWSGEVDGDDCAGVKKEVVVMAYCGLVDCPGSCGKVD